MEVIIKEFLYWIALGSGSIFLICLFISAMIRGICMLLDHLKVANVMREAMYLWLKNKNPNEAEFLKEDDLNV